MMPTIPERMTTSEAAERRAPHGAPCCPVCSGSLVEMRGSLRCARCSFTFCEGCGGDAGPAYSAHDE